MLIAEAGPDKMEEVMEEAKPDMVSEIV